MANIEISPDQNTVTVDGIKYKFEIGHCYECDLYSTKCMGVPCTSIQRKDSKVGIFKKVPIIPESLFSPKWK